MNHKTVDQNISKFLKNNLPKEPKDEWFLNKTMNRLPAKSERIFSTPEIVCYTLAIIILLALLAFESITLTNNQVLTVRDIIMFSAILSCFLVILTNITVPIVRRN